ncbi:MAG: T9SS type A sorting domain-containing protein [Bacteroidales bacterium]|nr:T9SS type A sorting domain-containing protein [Bacteroidales bacterium]
MKKVLLLITGIAFAIASFSQNYPFPMNESGYSYPYGIVPGTVSNSTIQSKFKAWENAMWDESGNLGRIKYDDGTSTVSEGIAYGMLIYVYMANETNTQCQDHFDKLYNYYKKYSDSKGLMNWKVTGFNSVANGGSGAATDADLDVALALCLAAKQWGSSSTYNYATEAETILKNIYQYETSTHNGLRVFKPGDSWDNNGNPCYFTQASVGVFKQAQENLGFTTTKDWATIYDDGLTYLEKSERNGLWPNWTDWSSNYAPASRGGDGADFGWDACRVPWRIGWDYVWFGSSSSKAMLEKTVAMMSARGALSSPSKVGYFSNLTGSSYNDLQLGSESYLRGNVAWTGSLACAFMIDDDYQSYLDTYYNDLKSKTGSAYYAQTLQVLYLLTLSGNAANFYDCDGGSVVITNPVISAAETDGSKITLTCSKKMVSSNNYSGFTIYKGGVAQSNAISSMSVSGKTITLTLNNNISIESGDMLAISYNGTYLQSEEGGTLGNLVKMTVKNNVPGGNTLLADCENGEVTLLGGTWYSYVGKGTQSYEIVSGGANSTSHSAHFTYNTIGDYAGMGFNILEDETAYDFSGSTGITFYHKGSAATLEIGTSAITDYSYHTVEIQSHNSWTPVTVEWTNVQRPSWGTGSSLDFNDEKLYSQITKFQWKVTSGSGEFYIDEVTLVGKTIDISLDHSKLEATLATANTLYNGATTDKYPQSAITTFYNAIDAAATTNMTATTQSELDNANTTLTKAIATFKASEIKPVVNKEDLATLINSTKSILNTTTAGTAVGQYSATLRTKLQTALSNAETINNKATATQTEVDNQVTALRTAYNAYMASEVKTAVDDLEFAFSVYPNPCVDVLNIEANNEIAFVKILGLNGSKSMFEINQTSTQISVNSLANGIYVMQVVFADGSVQTTQFIKK